VEVKNDSGRDGTMATPQRQKQPRQYLKWTKGPRAGHVALRHWRRNPRSTRADDDGRNKLADERWRGSGNCHERRARRALGVKPMARLSDSATAGAIAPEVMGIASGIADSERR